MACYTPLDAWQTESGEIVFSERGKIRRALKLPCGSCVGCRIEAARQWGVRCVHEAQMHTSSYFVTLTYDDDHLPNPPMLVYRDFQLFMKRLRKRFGKVRFFMCGEYGESNGRPHFHACLFGLRLDDLVLHKRSSNGVSLYRSSSLDSIWQLGFASVGDVTFDSAVYIANYMAKSSGVVRFDAETGEVFTREFRHMSLKPGIGQSFIEKYRGDVFNYDHVVINGRCAKPPRFYDRWLERVDPLAREALEPGRYLKALRGAEDSSPARLAVREIVARAGLAQKKREL